MTDRDKLVELLRQIDFDFSEECVACSEDGYKCTPDLAEFFADRLIASGVTVNEWRPASEPPKEECRCLIRSRKSGNVLVAQYKPEQRSWAYVANQHLISHWMPLPKPPKEVDKCD